MGPMCVSILRHLCASNKELSSVMLLLWESYYKYTTTNNKVWQQTHTCAFSTPKAPSLFYVRCKLFSFTHSRGTIAIHRHRRRHTHTPDLVGKHNYRSIKINKQGKSSTFNRVKVSVEKCTDPVNDLLYIHVVLVHTFRTHRYLCRKRKTFLFGEK